MQARVLAVFFTLFIGGSVKVFSAPNVSFPRVQNVGRYSSQDVKRISKTCVRSGSIKALKLSPNANQKCAAGLRIRSVALTYDGGFTQMFEYPNVGGQAGSPFSETLLSVMPKTRCLERVSVDMNNKSCSSSIDVGLVY